MKVLEISYENRAIIKSIFGEKYPFFRQRIRKILYLGKFYYSGPLTKNASSTYTFLEIALDIELRRLNRYLDYEDVFDLSDSNMVLWLDQLKQLKPKLEQAINDCQNKSWNWININF